MRNGETPQHLISWAPSDWLTSRVRSRSALTGDPMLRTVYFELLNVLYANGGSVPAEPDTLSDLLLLPAAEIERCLPTLRQLGSIVCEDGEVRQPRVSRELEKCRELSHKRRRAAQLRWDGQPEKEEKRETWLTPFGEAWEERLGGTPPYGEMARAFAPLREKYLDLAERWRAYLAATEERYASPTAFAKRAGVYGKRPTPRPAPPPPALPPKDSRAAQRWDDAVGIVEIPPHLKRTWLLPIEPRTISDDGTLLVVAPTKEHAAAVTGRYQQRLVSALGQTGGRAVGRINAVVIEEEQREHEGGL